MPDEKTDPPHPAPMVSSEDIGDFTDAPWTDAEAEQLRCAGCSLRDELETLKASSKS